MTEFKEGSFHYSLIFVSSGSFSFAGVWNGEKGETWTSQSWRRSHMTKCSTLGHYLFSLLQNFPMNVSISLQPLCFSGFLMFGIKLGSPLPPIWEQSLHSPDTVLACSVIWSFHLSKFIRQVLLLLSTTNTWLCWSLLIWSDSLLQPEGQTKPGHMMYT